MSFQEVARSSFEALLSASSGQRRQTHGELQERISNLLQNIRQVFFFFSKYLIGFYYYRARFVSRLKVIVFLNAILCVGRQSFAAVLFAGYPTTVESSFVEDIRLGINDRVTIIRC